jgi:hypothetical protein
VQGLQLPLQPVHVVIIFMIRLAVRAARLTARAAADCAVQPRGGGMGGPGGVAAAAPVAGQRGEGRGREGGGGGGHDGDAEGVVVGHVPPL